MKKSITPLLFLSLFFTQQLSAQDFWEHWYPDTLPQFSVSLSYATDMTPTADGGYLLAGDSDFPTGAIRHFSRLVKTDSEGNLEWETTLYEDEVMLRETKAVTEMPDGSIIVISRQNNSPYVTRLEADGSILWDNWYGQAGIKTLWMNEVQPQEDGSILIFGAYMGDFTLFKNPAIYHIDTDGSLMNSYEFYCDNGVGEFFDFAPIESGGWIAVGESRNDFSSSPFGLSMKIDENFMEVWEHNFDLSEMNQVHTVQIDYEDNIYYGGHTEIDEQNKASILKMDMNGNPIWHVLHQSSSTNSGICADLIINSANQPVFVGNLVARAPYPTEESFFGFMGILNPSNGSTLEFLDFGDFVSHAGSSIYQDEIGCYVIGGLKNGHFSLTRTCDFTNSTDELQLEMAISLSPNPTSGIMTISIADAIKDELKYNIYTLDGKLVQSGRINSSTTNIDLVQLPLGVYILQINKGAKVVASEKLILQK